MLKKLACVVGTLAVLATGSAFASPIHRDIRHDRQEIRHDRRDIRHDRREMRHHRHDARAHLVRRY